jgi:hypothetical protein
LALRVEGRTTLVRHALQSRCNQHQPLPHPLPPACDLQLSHSRKMLLKLLLRTITLSSYAPSGALAAARPHDEDSALLYACLKARCAAAPTEQSI